MATVQTKTAPETTPIHVLVESARLPAFTVVEGRVYSFPRVLNSDLVQGMTADLLEAMLLDGMRPMNAPELLDANLAAAVNSQITKDMDYKARRESDDPILRGSHTTSTLLATGKTKMGKIVYVVAHEGNPFINPERVREAEQYGIPRSDISPDYFIRFGLPILTDKEFLAILDKEDGTRSDKRDVYVFSEREANNQFVDHNFWTLHLEPSTYRNGLLTAFAGGEERKARLIEELKKRAENLSLVSLYDTTDLNIFRRMASYGANVGSFLGFTDSYINDYVGSLIFNTRNLSAMPQFVGIPKITVQKVPSLEEVVGALSAGGLIRPEDAARAYELLGPLYKPTPVAGK